MTGNPHLGRAEFTGAQFSGDAWFGDARFSGDAWFGDARFAGDAGFTGAQFSSDARFGGARFSNSAGFDDARFSNSAGFDGAQVSGDARFGGARFSGDAWFGDAQFSGEAWFGRAQFPAEAWFAGAQFSVNAEYTEAQFSYRAEFDGAQVSGDARFDRARFEGLSMFGPLVCAGTVVLSGAVFVLPVTLEIAAREVVAQRTRWESTATVRLRHQTVDLSHAVLSAPVAVTDAAARFTKHDGGALDEQALTGSADVRVASVQGADAAGPRPATSAAARSRGGLSTWPRTAGSRRPRRRGRTPSHPSRARDRSVTSVLGPVELIDRLHHHAPTPPLAQAQAAGHPHRLVVDRPHAGPLDRAEPADLAAECGPSAPCTSPVSQPHLLFNNADVMLPGP
ncbi:pentapeptide repeat-containing protein [Streptomyces flaveolus]|uniref:pentapeptide repeat-containing protein n=1 Tax=Streptomyces flaveolus TaxID=67297 RepID=UPI00341C2953